MACASSDALAANPDRPMGPALCKQWSHTDWEPATAHTGWQQIPFLTYFTSKATDTYSDKWEHSQPVKEPLSVPLYMTV